VSLLTGSTDSGQGSETVLAQIVAEELGISIEDVQVSHVDTDLTPIDPGSYGSRVTSIAGNAAQLAAVDARSQLTEVAARRLDVHAEELEFRDRKIFVKKNPERKISFKQLAQLACYAGSGRTILGRGTYAHDIEVPNWETGEGNLSAAYSFGAQVAEVEVDVETGQVWVINTAAAHDCGFAINPMAAEGQFEGSISGGLGQALLEGFDIEKGQTLNPNLMGYGLPTALDMPPVKTIFVETLDPVGPFGAKEAGEGTQISTVPAIVNAISHAIGIHIQDLPITPEKVLKALEDVRAS
jgi:4-hydroxybenzoyl-CoA reductase subunit alpha